ncbi:hypothetical protein V6N13_058207 [Hibiscus sabdariffa]
MHTSLQPILEYNRSGMGYKPNPRQKMKKFLKMKEQRRVRLIGQSIEEEPMQFPKYLKLLYPMDTFILWEEKMETSLMSLEMIHELSINAVGEDVEISRNRSKIRPCPPGCVLNNWTAVELPIAFKTLNESSDINCTNDTATNSRVDFKRAICFGEEVKIGTLISLSTNDKLVSLLQEFKDVFAWTYEDMPGLDTSIVTHKLPLKPECKPMQQKLRRMRPEMLLQIRDEVRKQFDVGFLQVAKYPEWVANVVPVLKKNGKVRMCVDYRDLNHASPKDNFPLPHIDTLVDNTAKHCLFSFMDGFSGYH